MEPTEDDDATVRAKPRGELVGALRKRKVHRDAHHFGEWVERRSALQKVFVPIAKLPVCGCGREPEFRVVNARPIRPGQAELDQNPRAASAKLRVAQREVRSS